MHGQALGRLTSRDLRSSVVLVASKMATWPVSAPGSFRQDSRAALKAPTAWAAVLRALHGQKMTSMPVGAAASAHTAAVAGEHTTQA